MLYLVLALVVLGLISAIFGIVSHRKGEEEEPLQEGVSCNTCNGENSKCEQDCMMEAATKEIEYYTSTDSQDEKQMTIPMRKWKSSRRYSIPCNPKRWQAGTEV